MRLSVLAHTFSNDLTTAVAAARQAAFTGVVLDPTVYPSILHTSQTGKREIVHLLSRHDQALVAIDLRLNVGGLSSKHGRPEREIDRITHAMALARGLRTNLVLCDLGTLPPAPGEAAPKPVVTSAMLGKLILPDAPASLPAPALPRDEPFERDVDDAFREIGACADRAGCLIAFRASLGTFAALSAALDRARCPWFGVDLDPLAMLTDEWSTDAILSRLSKSLLHVRGRDGMKGTGARVVATEVGKGQIDWQELRSLLQDADYDRFLTLDAIDLPNRSASATRGAAFLQTLAK